MKTPTDISPRQFTANLCTKADGGNRYLQFVDFQRLFYCKNTFVFTGKEKDSLRLDPQSGGLCGARLTSPPDLFTRFYYFGARYYDPTLSGLFLSVDPRADKYPSISPYAYCAWNPIKIIDPSGDTLDVVNKKGQLLFSLDDNLSERSTITAIDLYNKGIQWSEPNADNYMPLLLVNRDIESIEGIAHFSWDQIEEFALTDRLMIEYRQGGSGDFKKNKEFLCTVDGIPYWTDIVGQIAFAINCYRNQLMKGESHQKASDYTQKIGHLFATGFIGIDKYPNNADNWMIKRVCAWAAKGFDIGEYKKCGRFTYRDIKRNSYEFNKLAQWKMKK